MLCSCSVCVSYITHKSSRGEFKITRLFVIGFNAFFISMPLLSVITVYPFVALSVNQSNKVSDILNNVLSTLDGFGQTWQNPSPIDLTKLVQIQGLLTPLLPISAQAAKWAKVTFAIYVSWGFLVAIVSLLVAFNP